MIVFDYSLKIFLEKRFLFDIQHPQGLGYGWVLKTFHHQ